MKNEKNCPGIGWLQILTWVDRPLSIGDETQIKIIESDQVDDLQFRERQAPDLIEKARREYYEKLKREYESEDGV